MPIYPLSEQIRFARTHSPYYRELYQHLPKTPTLHDLPLAHPKKFWQANHPRHGTVLTGPLTDALAIRSGGTTGAPKFSWWTALEWEEFTTSFGYSLAAAGLHPGARVANLFYAGDLYASFSFVLDSLTRCPVSNVRFPLGGALPPERVAHTVEDFELDTLTGLPTTMQALAEYLVQHQRHLPSVKLLLVGGELLFSDQRPLLHKAFPNARLRSVGYASVDAGLLGRPVSSDDLQLHHTWAPAVLTEIVSEDTGEPITEEGRPGALVVTDLRRRLMPILRYPVGDRAQWVDREAGLFRLLGRTSEALRISHVTLYVSDVEELVRQVDTQHTVRGLQLVAYHRERRDGVLLRAAVDDPTADHRALEQALATALWQSRRTYAEAVAHHHIHPLKVEWVRHSDLEVNPRSGKVRRLIDARPDTGAREASATQEPRETQETQR